MVVLAVNFIFVLGILASLSGFLVYGKSIIEKKTNPSLGGVVLFSINTCWAAFYSQAVSDPLQTSITWTFGLGNFSVLFLTLYTKQWAPLNKEDVALFILSIFVLIAQILFKTPENAIIFACAIEILGTLMVVAKMLKAPNKENLEGWSLATASYLLGVLGQELTQGHGPNMWFSAMVTINCLIIIGLGLVQKKE